MAVVNMVGWKNGHLTVIQRDITRTGGAAYWICKCDACGGTKTFRGQYLRENKPESCGCIKKEYTLDNKKEYKNFIGKRFGRLTVLERDLAKPAGRGHPSYWVCQCDCGEQKTISYPSLVNGKTQSCGCFKKEQMSEMFTSKLLGKHFGDLTVIELLEEERRVTQGHRPTATERLWRCKCSCGNEIILPTGYLTRDEVTSCGCKHVASKGEAKIKDILEKSNCNFEREKTFDDCRSPETNKLLRYDFYLPDYKILIEYDGEQHFDFSHKANPGWNTKEAHLKTVERDKVKNHYAIKNNILLFRIPYTDFSQINTISDILNEKYLVKG